MPKCLLLVIAGVVAVPGGGGLLAAEPARGFTLLEALKDPLLQNTVHRLELQAAGRPPRFAPDGAMGQNEKWQRGAAPEWFIEGPDFKNRCPPLAAASAWISGDKNRAVPAPRTMTPSSRHRKWICGKELR